MIIITIIITTIIIITITIIITIIIIIMMISVSEIYEHFMFRTKHDEMTTIKKVIINAK